MIPDYAITIPPPPSVNSIFRYGKGKMYRSRPYMAWLGECIALHKGRKPEPFQRPVSVAVTLHGGSGFKKNRDLDNCLKVVVDLLRHLEVILDDNVQHVVDVRISYIPPQSKKEKARALVSVSEIR